MLKNLNEKKNIRHPEKIYKPDNISPSKPSWLKVRAPIGKIFDETKRFVRRFRYCYSM